MDLPCRSKDSKTLMIGVGILLIIHLILYLSLTSETFYCQIPNMSLFYRSKALPDYEDLPLIYVITPTYARHVQKAELTRLSHTFMLVPNLHWIIVEDSPELTESIRKFVNRLKFDFEFYSVTHLNEPTPKSYKLKPGEAHWKKPKGIWQRNRGLRWLREKIEVDSRAVVYFADDDNTYDLELFNEMRYVKKVGVWPVAFVGGMLVERPIVDHNNRVVSFNSQWQQKRPFPIDMSGFAVNLRYAIERKNLSFSSSEPIGFVESQFLGQLIESWDELEPKALKCTRILVWHTRSQNPQLHEERKLRKPSNDDIDL